MAIYDCGSSSTILVSNHDLSTPQSFIVDGIQLYLQPGSTTAFTCSGQIDVTPWGNVAVQKILSAQSVFNETFLLCLAGLIAGALFAKVLTRQGV